ncbi:MAG: hypothetical protein MI739_00230 [Bacteroidales bacterium]|nr:hypothetical protein [Bacteroidales bacterium]
MSYTEDFNQWKDSIVGMPLSETKLPNAPIEEFTADAETLYQEALQDKETLVAAGLDANTIDNLLSLTGALRYCQAIWMNEYKTRKEAQKEWNKQSTLAYNLRNELMHHCDFAFREDRDLQLKIKRLRKGGSNADMVQDLIELAVLAEKNPSPLAAINFDVQLIEKAKAESKKMAELLALVNGTRDHNDGNKLIRDKAYTKVLACVHEIREFGRYVFWKNQDRLKHYRN